MSCNFLSNASAEGNFSLRGGPFFNPDQTRSSLSFSSMMKTSKEPRLISDPAGFNSDSISPLVKGDEASVEMTSAARFLKTCQDLQ